MTIKIPVPCHIHINHPYPFIRHVWIEMGCDISQVDLSKPLPPLKSPQDIANSLEFEMRQLTKRKWTSTSLPPSQS